MTTLTTDDRIALTLEIPTGRRKLSRITLRPGLIDADAREFFSYSSCHLLACALHEATSWPLIVIKVADRNCWHAAVRTPCGRLLDINGLRPHHHVETEWSEFAGGCPTRSHTASTLSDFYPLIGLPDSTPDTWWKNDGNFHPAPGTGLCMGDIATPFATTLLTRYHATREAASR